jgi:hypothetical protein
MKGKKENFASVTITRTQKVFFLFSFFLPSFYFQHLKKSFEEMKLDVRRAKQMDEFLMELL